MIVTYSGFSAVCPGFPELCSPQVTLDGVGVARTAFDPPHGRMTLSLPPHAGGPAMLTLTGTQGDSQSMTIHYATGDDYERVLLPLVPYQTAGANGSLWLVTAMTLNGSNDISELKGPFLVPGGIQPSPPLPHAFPGKILPLTLAISPYGDGAFLTVGKYAANDFAFEERVADLSRNAKTAGTEVPLARERDFKAKIVLLDLPNDARYRSMLRVYGFNESSDRIRIRVFPVAGDPLVDEVHETSNAVSPYPAYLQISLQTWPVLDGKGPLRVELTSESGAKLWAFVSVTNNETQQVTIVSPQ